MAERVKADWETKSTDKIDWKKVGRQLDLDWRRWDLQTSLMVSRAITLGMNDADDWENNMEDLGIEMNKMIANKKHEKSQAQLEAEECARRLLAIAQEAEAILPEFEARRTRAKLDHIKGKYGCLVVEDLEPEEPVEEEVPKIPQLEVADQFLINVGDEYLVKAVVQYAEVYPKKMVAKIEVRVICVESINSDEESTS